MQLTNKKTDGLCPECHSNEVTRSRRRGLVEQIILPALQVRPYRCMECNHRFFLKDSEIELATAAKAA
jgi:hypothetical protein